MTRFKEGDKVGVGCLAASCLECEFCKNSEENYCDQIQFTYNGIFWDGSITYGGYSKMLVADQRYNKYYFLYYWYIWAIKGSTSTKKRTDSNLWLIAHSTSILTTRSIHHWFLYYNIIVTFSCLENSRVIDITIDKYVTISANEFPLNELLN